MINIVGASYSYSRHVAIKMYLIPALSKTQQDLFIETKGIMIGDYNIYTSV